jgi:hypothetical protein
MPVGGRITAAHIAMAAQSIAVHAMARHAHAASGAKLLPRTSILATALAVRFVGHRRALSAPPPAIEPTIRQAAGSFTVTLDGSDKKDIANTSTSKTAAQASVKLAGAGLLKRAPQGRGSGLPMRVDAPR